MVYSGFVLEPEKIWIHDLLIRGGLESMTPIISRAPPPTTVTINYTFFR